MTKTFRNVRVAAFVGTAFLTFAAQPALAAQGVSTDLGVSATVTHNCVVSTMPVEFGNVDVTTGADIDASGAFSVKCTSGTPWTASADLGLGSGANFAARKMSSGGHFLDYALFTDGGRTNLWGDGVEDVSSVFAGVGSGSTEERIIYARVAGGQTSVPAGEYADTVSVTVSY